MKRVGHCPCSKTRFVCHHIPCKNVGIPKEDILICSRCRMYTYCSKECQVNDWKSLHKSQCKAIATMTFIDYMNVITTTCFVAELKDCHAHPEHPLNHKINDYVINVIWCTKLKQNRACGKCKKDITKAYCWKQKDNIYEIRLCCMKMLWYSTTIDSEPKHVFVGKINNKKRVHLINISSILLKDDEENIIVTIEDGTKGVIKHKTRGFTYDEEKDSWC